MDASGGLHGGRVVRWIVTITVVTACGRSRPVGATNKEALTRSSADVTSVDTTASADTTEEDLPSYTGHSRSGIPHYARRSFSPAERALLRSKHGIENPNRLYVSDSTEDGLLKYDTRRKTCAICYVSSYGVGFVSVRRPGESWDAVERRVRATPLRNFPPSARRTSTSTADLDPEIRADADQMLAEARRLGFTLRVRATYRSPEREAYLMAEGHGRTHTLTSMHSYGRALDIVVADGNLHHPPTRASWIAFRRWVSRFHGGEFRILGTPERTWDWPHVEIPSPVLGFRTIDEALGRARACETGRGSTPCDFPPHLPGTAAAPDYVESRQ